MPAQAGCLTDGICCTPSQPIPKDASEPPETPIPGEVAPISILAVETDPKAREANLFKLDSLVVGLPLAKMEISEKEVNALEAEARRALDEGYCTFCRNLVRRDDISKDHVVVVLTPKVVSHWCSEISYPRLEFYPGDQQVRRPPLVSAFPAALVPADLEMPTALRFRVTALPSSRTILTVGVAKWPGFRVYFGKGFGEEEDSWGLQWKAEDGLPVQPSSCKFRLSKGDVLCVTCDTWKGASTISLNGKEAATFSVPCGDTFVLGATLSTGCSLKIDS
jgi:hypothetical protein